MGSKERGRKLDEAAGRYTSYARTLGADGGETIEAVSRSWEELTGEPPLDGGTSP